LSYGPPPELGILRVREPEVSSAEGIPPYDRSGSVPARRRTRENLDRSDLLDHSGRTFRAAFGRSPNSRAEEMSSFQPLHLPRRPAWARLEFGQWTGGTCSRRAPVDLVRHAHLDRSAVREDGPAWSARGPGQPALRRIGLPARPGRRTSPASPRRPRGSIPYSVPAVPGSSAPSSSNKRLRGERSASDARRVGLRHPMKPPPISSARTPDPRATRARPAVVFEEVTNGVNVPVVRCRRAGPLGPLQNQQLRPPRDLLVDEAARWSWRVGLSRRAPYARYSSSVS